MDSLDFISFFKKNYKSNTSSFISGMAILFIDIIALCLCVGIGFFVTNLIDHSAVNFRSFVRYMCYFPLIIMVYYASGLYPGIMPSPSGEVRKLFVSNFFCFAGISISILFNDSNIDGMQYKITTKILQDTDSIWASVSLLIATLISIIIMPAAREIARHAYGKFKWWGVPAVIYGTNESYAVVANRLEKRKDLGYKPVLIIDNNATECKMYGDIPVFPDSKEILDAIKKLKLKVAFVSDYKGERLPIVSYYRYVINVSKHQDLYTSTLQLRDLGGLLGFSSTHNLTKKSKLITKRLLDLLLLLFSAPIILPVCVLLAILVKLTSRGPILYGHKRVGKNGKIIKCWKFRSMYKNSQEMLEKILKEDPAMREEWERDRKFVNDPRVTKFGKILRKTSLDELPQLLNILLGQMSFVGPRPVTNEELEKYGQYANYVLSVTPGLSGMWQISGRSETGYEERIAYDTYYIQNWSVWLDIWIIIKTIWVVINGKGAY
ncbi:MAG: undecaprenyl-phosphate galactose phosphotransferase WbaP [Treponema sp.]|nr:undecaprenyl-phosphate galactose phosphotransferase WbaP [Treponema sp.]